MATALDLLVLAATLSTIQTVNTPSSTPLIVQMRNGATIEIAAPRAAASHRYIVEFNDPPLAARRRTAVASAAVVASYQTTFDRFRRDLANVRFGKKAAENSVKYEYFRTFNGVSVTLDDADLDAVRHLSYVKRVAEDTPVQAFASEDTNRLTRLGVDRVWSELNALGDGIVAAVIDTGIDYNHPALGGGFGPGFKVVGGYDFVDDDDDPMDEYGHGTHVAGILAGDGEEVRGVAPHAHLLAYRVLDANGSGTISDVIMGIERSVDPNLDGDLSDHADVANLSLGGPGDADSPVSIAVDGAVEAGVVVSIAAGNTPGQPTVAAPGSSRLGITVGNSDSEDALNVTSSRGPTFHDWNLKPEVVAPGTLIRSAKLGGGTLLASGTSMAAPHVAGAAALLLELHPDWTPADVKAALVGSAKPIEEEVMAQGGGRIDVYDAATLQRHSAGGGLVRTS